MRRFRKPVDRKVTGVRISPSPYSVILSPSTSALKGFLVAIHDVVLVEGEKTERVVITACDATDADRPVEVTDGTAVSAASTLAKAVKA